MYILLETRAIAKITGKDNSKFLQGLLSNDITKLSPNNPLYACMLTPQGKYFADFFLVANQEEILLDMPALRQDEILKKLNIYKLRSSVTITKCPEYKVTSFIQENNINLNKSIIFTDPRSNNMCKRGFIHQDNLVDLQNNFIKSQDAYDNARIDNFIAEGEKDLIPEKSFLLEYGLDELNAIDYNKGCYVGQELIARTHYLGKIRKQIVQVKAKQTLPILGTEIYANKQKLGIICSSSQNRGLALVRVEDVNNLDQNQKITANNIEIELRFKEIIND